MHKRTCTVAWVFKKVLLPAVLFIGINAGAQVTDDVVEKDTTSYFSHIDATAYNTVQERVIPDSVINRLKSEDEFWYADVNFKKPEPPKQNNQSLLAKLLTAQWFRTLIWFIIIGSFIAVVVLFLINSNIQLFRKKANYITSNHEQEISEDIFSIDYGVQINKAIKNNNYRLAVRLYYLQILAHMAQKNIIRYQQDKTNSDYLQQLYSTTYYKDFFTLTRNFEYTWYGQFNVTKEGFEKMQHDFTTFNQRMGF